MVTLFMDAKEFGLRGDHVTAHYASLEEARAQAEHNIRQGKQRPIKICDEAGAMLWEAEAE